MSKTKSAGVVTKVISYLLIFLVITGVIGFIFTFTNGFNEDFKTFYIEYKGESILSSDKKLVLDRGQEHRFDVKYTFDFDESETKDYSVAIYANSDKNNSFDFSIDGEVYAYYAEGDITDAFDLTLHDTYFTITVPEEATVETILKNLYPDSVIEVPEEGIKINYPFTLVVSSYNNEVTYNINFAFYVGVTGIEIDQEVIVF